MTTREKDKKRRFDELLSQGMKPSEALQMLEMESRDQTEQIDVSTPQKDKTPAKLGYTFIGELKHLGREVGREVTEFPKRKIKEAAEDVEAKRAYRESFRKHKISAASPRGAEAEERKWRAAIKKEELLRDINIAKQKAYAVEMARQDARREAKQQQYTRFRPITRRPYNMWAFESARQIDPLGIYSLGKPQIQNGRRNQSDSLRIFELRGTPESANLWLSLVGYRPSSQQESIDRKKRPKRRVQNIFSGMWEWV